MWELLWQWSRIGTIAYVWFCNNRHMCVQNFWEKHQQHSLYNENDDILTRSDLLNNIRHTILVRDIEILCVHHVKCNVAPIFINQNKIALRQHKRTIYTYTFIAMLWLISYELAKIEKNRSWELISSQKWEGILFLYLL